MATVEAQAPKKLRAVVDRLGDLYAQIKDLKNEVGVLEKTLKDSGLPIVEGELFRAVVSNYASKSVDWKTICEKLEPSSQLLTAHSKYVDKCSIRVVSRRPE